MRQALGDMLETMLALPPYAAGWLCGKIVGSMMTLIVAFRMGYRDAREKK